MTDFRRTLLRQVEEEVLACIGCNDCMLACPLAEAGSVSIAELNTAVHEPVIRSENVIRFVTACTQCRQCVPACPADLSRADMVLFNKLKVEDTVVDHILPLQFGSFVQSSGWGLDALADQLAKWPFFQGVDVNELRRMLLKVTLRRLVAGEDLCREGEYHERLSLVLQGALEQTSQGANGGQTRILVLAPGALFGEMGVMANQPEPFSVTALEMSVVVDIPKMTVRLLMEASTAFGATMDELYRRRALWTYARRPTSLGRLSEPAMQELLAGSELTLLKAGEYVFREGDAPRDGYLVRNGFLRVSRRDADGSERGLLYFREGDLFGILPLLFGERTQTTTVQATSRAEVVRVPGSLFQTVLARHPGAREALLNGALEGEQAVRSVRPSVLAGPMGAIGGIGGMGALGGLAPPTAAPMEGTTAIPMSWNALVDQGVAAGKEVLVVDQNLCTNCENCVDACGRRHKYSRLQLRGLQMENFLFPTACRHCNDPVCLLCSVNGIVRRPGGEISIVEENCIGCGACAERCPYGNISMHEVDPPKQSLLFDLWDLLRSGSRRARALDQLKVARKAVKCDLCAGHDDYACVTACPVGAAFRVDPVKAFGDLNAVFASDAAGGPL